MSPGIHFPLGGFLFPEMGHFQARSSIKSMNNFTVQHKLLSPTNNRRLSLIYPMRSIRMLGKTVAAQNIMFAIIREI